MTTTASESPAYFSSEWKPEIEFLIKIVCPECKSVNFVNNNLNEFTEIDVLECHKCKKCTWLHPRWYVEQTYGHYIKNEKNPEGEFEDFVQLSISDDIVKIVSGKKSILTVDS